MNDTNHVLPIGITVQISTANQLEVGDEIPIAHNETHEVTNIAKVIETHETPAGRTFSAWVQVIH